MQSGVNYGKWKVSGDNFIYDNQIAEFVSDFIAIVDYGHYDEIAWMMDAARHGLKGDDQKEFFEQFAKQYVAKLLTD